MEEEEDQVVKSKKELLIERLKAKYPDIEGDDEDAIYGVISDDYDSYDQERASYSDNEKKLTELLNSDNRAASFLVKWKDGKNPCVALIEEFGDDFREALDDPSMMDKFAEATKKYNERTLKSKELNALAEQNLEASISSLDEAQKEIGVSDEVITQAFEFFNTMVNDAIVNRVSKETWAMFIKAIGYDKDVAEAEHIGEVRGKNTKIGELKVKQSPNVPPSLTGGGGGKIVEPTGIRAPSPSVWAGEKRIKGR